MSKSLFSSKNIQRAIGIVLIALFAVLVLFGAYYYWDRYVVRLDDESPLEMGVVQLEQAIREDPQNPETRVALAEFYLDQKLYQKALEQTTQVLSLYPDHNMALLISGISYVRLDQPEEAVEPLELFVAARKDLEMARSDNLLETGYYFLGESYIKSGRPRAAISALEGALVINRSDADALYLLGLAYQGNGQAEEALEQYHEAVRFVPDFTEAYSGMIESYTALEQPDYVAYARGMQALTIKDYETAQTHLEYATETLPNFAPAFLGLSLTYEKLNQLEAALTSIERALELKPDDFAAQQTFGRIQATMGSGE